jgi:hypothetical protein
MELTGLMLRELWYKAWKHDIIRQNEGLRMTIQSTAQGIASLGRHGDDTIVHMNHDEVKGLQALAQQHGTTLTINPHTGMPEAFNLGGLFKSLLPMAAGFFAPELFGAESFLGSPLGAGLLVGGVTGALTGNIGQGLMAGLGAYGGAGLGKSLAGLGSAGNLTKEAVTGEIAKDTGSNLIGSTGVTNPELAKGLGNLGYDMTGETAANINKYGPLSEDMAHDISNITHVPTAAENVKTLGSLEGNTGASTSYLDKVGQGIKNLVNPNNQSFTTAEGKVVPAGSGYSQYTNPAVGGSVTQLAAPVVTGVAGAYGEDLLKQTPVDYAAAQPKKRIQTGTDASGNPTYTYIPITAYDPRETLNLNDPYSAYGITPPPALKLPPTAIAKEGGEVKAYAMGGTVTTGGLRDLYSATDNVTNPNLSRDGYGVGRLDSLARQQSMNDAQTTGYADGGTVDTTPSLNLNNLPTLNLNTGTTNPGIATIITSSNRPNRFFGNMMGQSDFSNYRPNLFGNAGINFASDNRNGLSFRTIGMAHGGYLDGQGDGMSDSIPATIEGKQPARLADGEFVIPADVVSHLGNGSSKAGSKKLYAMMQKVRKARTGNPKQGKEINPNKYMPA